MPEQHVVIIGAGVAGLSAGCYARMNGLDAEICEMQGVPGGLCTSWERGGYTFDGCIDWLTGSAPDGMMHPLWREVGAITGRPFLYQEEYCRYTRAGAPDVVFHLDMDRLERELTALSPADRPVIRELCGLIRRLEGFRPPVAKAMEVMGPLDYVKMMCGMMPRMGQFQAFLKYGKLTMGELGSRFKNPEMRQMFAGIWGEQIPVSLFAATMAWCASRTAGYPQGGSLELARDIEKRYLSLGGRIRYRTTVQSIVVKEGRAAGVITSDGKEVPADVVISAADAHTTVFGMLGGCFLSDQLREWFDTRPTFPPYLQVSLGVNRDLRGEPRLRYWKLDEPMDVGGCTSAAMIIHNYSFDPTLAPQGKTPLVVRYFTDYEYWQQLAKDRERYRAQKEALAAASIQELEKLYPGIREQVEVVDVATPATYVRYTGTWRAATMSWLPTTRNFGKQLPKTLPGLDDFYLAGQWLFPAGGLPNALKSGRDVVQMICRKNGARFRTSVPR